MTETGITPTWQGVTLTGTYCESKPGGARLNGTATFKLTQRVVNRTERKIFPPGIFATTNLSTDPSSPSFSVVVPATDDPDNLPNGAMVEVTVKLDGFPTPEIFLISVPVATAGALDLVDFVPTTAISAKAATQAGFATLLGKPGGVASLTAEGVIPLSQIPADAGGLPTAESGSVMQVDQAGKWVASPLTIDSVSGLRDELGNSTAAGGVASVTIGNTVYEPVDGNVTLPATSGATNFSELKDVTQVGTKVAQAADDQAARGAIGAVGTGDLPFIVAGAGVAVSVDGNAYTVTATGPVFEAVQDPRLASSGNIAVVVP